MQNRFERPLKRPEDMKQADASRTLLENSQQTEYPYTIDAFGLKIEVRRGVFSPKHFNGWEVFTRTFPKVMNETVLEIGCGAGITAIYLAKNGAKKVVAVDINRDAVLNTKENVQRNEAHNVEVRESNIFSNVSSDEKFDKIYWNLPFIYMPINYQYKSVLERSLFDPGYQYIERFLREAKHYLSVNGRVIAGLADFADLKRFKTLADRYGYTVNLIASEESVEVNPVEFQLYELRLRERRSLQRLYTVFYAMPFTGKSHEEIVTFRRNLHDLAEINGLKLLEQFIGIEEENKFESHGYLPLFIAKKDHDFLKQADFVIADYSDHSIGRDSEIVLAKEVFDKRVIAIVPDSHMKNHPYVRLYSNYVLDSANEGFRLSSELSKFSLSSEMAGLTREQKDSIDIQVKELLADSGTGAICTLLPTELRQRWQTLFGDDYSSVLDWSFRPLPKTVRVNRLKSSAADFEGICRKYSWQAESMQLLDNIYRLQSANPDVRFGETQEYMSGIFYIQELASMLPTFALNPQPGETVLDLCAAPGSKTTQMAELMGNRGEVLAVDISEARLEVLKAALDRLGISNVKPLVKDGTAIGDLYHEQFDKVLVDVPCSCEGIFRYKAHKVFEWDLLQIYRMIEIQAALLLSGFKALKSGGTLVYCTCTYSPEENEAIVDSLLKKYDSADLVSLEFDRLKTRAGLTNWEHVDFDKRLSKTVRIYPMDNDTIGFFIAKIVKNVHAK